VSQAKLVLPATLAHPAQPEPLVRQGRLDEPDELDLADLLVPQAILVIPAQPAPLDKKDPQEKPAIQEQPVQQDQQDQQDHPDLLGKPDEPVLLGALGEPDRLDQLVNLDQPGQQAMLVQQVILGQQVILEQRGKLDRHVTLARLDQPAQPELREIQALSVNRGLPGSKVLTEDEELQGKEVLPAQPVLLDLLDAQDEQDQQGRLDQRGRQEPQVKLEWKDQPDLLPPQATQDQLARPARTDKPVKQV
jgi:hypothetical protein